MKKSEYIKQYSVKIKYPLGREGSGILIKNDDRTSYLATAKHNFTDRECGVDSWKYVDRDIDIFKNNLNEIEVLKNNNKICDVSDILYDYEDLIIFKITNHKDYTDKLDLLEILNDKLNDDIEYFFQGYSAKEGDGYISQLDSRNDIENYKYIIKDSKQHRITYVKGFSGSGVFIKDRESYYLVGIVLQKSDESSSYTIFNLPKIIEDKSIKQIKLKKDIFEVKDTAQMYTRIVNRNKNNFLIRKAKDIFQNKEHSYKDLDSSHLKEMVNYINKTNSFSKLEQKYNDELADIYLLGAFILNKDNRKKESLEYLEKARIFNPKYIRYKNNIEEYNPLEDINKGKLAFLDKKYDKAKKYFLRVLNKDIIKNKKIEIYEFLIQISNKDEKIEYYEKLLNLYGEEDIKDKSNIYFQLSELYHDVNLKDKNLTKAFNLIKDIEDESIYELKFKISEKFVKIDASNPQKSINMLKPLLKQISHLKPEYEAKLSFFKVLEELEGEKEISKHLKDYWKIEQNEQNEIYHYQKTYLKIQLTEEKEKSMNLENQLEEIQQENNDLLLNNEIIKKDLDEKNKIINMVLKFAIIPILLGILIAKYGQFSIFGFSF